MNYSTLCLPVDALCCEQTIDPLDSEHTLLLVFADTAVCQDVFVGIKQRFPKAKKIGCSTAGHIFEETIVDEEVILGIIQFSKTELVLASEDIGCTENSYAVGQAIAQQLNSESLKAIFMLSDGLVVNGSELVKGVSSVIDKDIAVTGGLAGDGDRFERTWVLSDGVAKSGCVVAVGFYGADLVVSHGSAGGWDKFGVMRTITEASSNVLYRLDDRPALSLYKEYLGERAQGLPSTGLLFPLALYTKEDGCEFVVRTILAVDEDNDSLTFAGDVPVGARVQLMRANFDRLIDGANQSAVSLVESVDSPPGLLIAISCVGRRLLLGERTEEELEATLEKVPEGTKQIGFYSYGEISPSKYRTCDLHNQTMTLTLLSEK